MVTNLWRNKKQGKGIRSLGDGVSILNEVVKKAFSESWLLSKDLKMRVWAMWRISGERWLRQSRTKTPRCGKSEGSKPSCCSNQPWRAQVIWEPLLPGSRTSVNSETGNLTHLHTALELRQAGASDLRPCAAMLAPGLTSPLLLEQQNTKKL